jgi:hypothetical protein
VIRRILLLLARVPLLAANEASARNGRSTCAGSGSGRPAAARIYPAAQGHGDRSGGRRGDQHRQFGAWANGVGNFDWAAAERTTDFHEDLLQGNGELSVSAAAPVGDVHVELPVDYRANVAYNVERWVVVARSSGAGARGVVPRRRRAPPGCR